MIVLRVTLACLCLGHYAQAELRKDYLNLPIDKTVVIKGPTTNRVVSVESIIPNNEGLELYDKEKKLTVVSNKMILNVIPSYTSDSLAALTEKQTELLLSWVNTLPGNVQKEYKLDPEELSAFLALKRQKALEAESRNIDSVSSTNNNGKDEISKISPEQQELHTSLVRWGMAMDDMDELKSYVFFITEDAKCAARLRIISGFIIKSYNLLEAGRLNEETYKESVAFFNECRKGSDLAEYGPAVIPVILNILSKAEYDSQEGFERMRKDRENNLYLKILHLTLDRYRQYFREKAA
jgi:hypothetical protein